jgi:hypothetical protein
VLALCNRRLEGYKGDSLGPRGRVEAARGLVRLELVNRRVVALDKVIY